MKTTLQTFLLLLCFWSSVSVSIGQTTIALQDFEVAPATPTMAFTAVGGANSTGNGLFPNSPKFVSGVRGYEINNGTTTLTFNTVNASGFNNIALVFRLASFSGTSGNGADVADNVLVEISTDGGTSWSRELQVNGNGNAFWSFASGTGVATTPYDGNNTPTAFAPGGGGSRTTDGYSTIRCTGLPTSANLRVRLTMLNNAAAEFWVVDDVKLEGDPIIACAHTIAAFTPTTGPKGTEVTITGTGFTASSTVFFNGIAASSVVFVNSTKLIATVPAGSVTGVITVRQAACDVFSGPMFTLLGQSGVCGTLLSNIIISEVYDKSSGSLGYIEIYNGTGATVDLTLYRIDRFANIGDASPSHAYTFPAGTTIAHGQVLFGKVSADANEAGVVPNFTFTGTTAGFNDADRLELVLISSGAVVDDFHDAVVGSVGYVYRRNTNITAPNPVFNSSEWTTATSGDVSNLGIYNFTLGGAPIVNTQPTDVSGCAINFSVTATAGAGGVLTYQWFYNENNGVATGWTAVTGAAFPSTTVLGATSNALSITGNLAVYNNYQFYCRVTENGACNVPSEAAQFTLSAERFFRSVATGNWTDATTWEMATSAAGPWSPACVYPVFDNSDYIHIMSGNNVSVNQDLVVDEVVIESNGILTITTSSLLLFNNGVGVDLQILGTLVDNGSGGNGSNFGTNSATWLLGANGEIIKTAGSSVAQYRDNYENGISSLPATATWRFRFVGSSNVPVITTNMFYPNLYFESTSGDHSFSAATEIFNGTTGGFATVKGNFYVGNTGTGAVEVFNTNTNVSPMQLLGDVIIGGNGSASISKFENNNAVTIGTGIEVFGNIIINSNGLLDFEDGTAAADGSVIVHSNWTDLNTGSGFDQGQSTVRFVGTTTQTVNKVSGNENFYNVVVNNSGGNIINNANNMVIKNDMTFINGIVLTSSSAYLVFEKAATATTASNASHVDGPVIKETDNAAVTAFTYPTGDNGIYGAIGIETRFNTGENFVAEYFNVGYGTYNVNEAELDHVSIIEHWLLDDVNNLGENVKVTLHWGPHSAISNYLDNRVGHFYTEAPSVINQWEREGASPFLTGNNTSGTVTSDTYVNTFSPFTIATVVNPLPLDLLVFEATKLKRTTELYWKVANEFAGDRYCIQRSADGYNFETLYCVDATHNNPVNAYTYIDKNPLVGVNYYRIYQIDYMGDDNYSFIRTVTFDDLGADVTIFPNPASDVVTIQVPNLKDASYTVEVIDVLGRIVGTQKITAGQLTSQVDVNTLAAGSYLVRVQGNNGIFKVETITVRR